MTNEFSNWLVQNGLSEAFTTNAGDTLYTNKEKKLVLYNKGDHSMLRITDTELYDTEITLFLERLTSACVQQVALR